MGVAAMISLGISAASTISGIIGGRKAEKRAQKSRKAAEALGAESLHLARGQFDQFRPIILDTTDFFSSTSLDDITSGRVLAPEGRAAMRALNQVQADRARVSDLDLARRGISNDLAGAAIRSQQRGQGALAAANIVDRSTQRAVNRRLLLTQSGLAAGRNLQGALGQQQANLLGQQQLAEDRIGREAKAAGSGLGLLQQQLPGIESGLSSLFSKLRRPQTVSGTEAVSPAVSPSKRFSIPTPPIQQNINQPRFDRFSNTA